MLAGGRSFTGGTIVRTLTWFAAGSRTTTALLTMATLAAATVGLSSCRFEKRPAPPYPDVQWQGAAPAGPLEGDPWVQAARKSLEAKAVAQNITDFTLPELEQTTGYELRSRLNSSVREYVQQNKKSRILPGPEPFLPVDVRHDLRGDTNLSEVRGCIAGSWASVEGDAVDRPEAFGVGYRLQRLANGTIRVEDSFAVSLPECAGADLPIALFTPAPEPSDITDSQDIVRPVRNPTEPG